MTASVLIYCEACRVLGVALVDRQRQALAQISHHFVAARPGDIGLQFLCARCGKVVVEG
jgi:hypothetical protein